MNLKKSGLFKKIIIILIVLILFNIAVPKRVNAVSLGGILFKPISAIILTILTAANCTLSLFLHGASVGIGGIQDAVDHIDDDVWSNAFFVGPDTIFSGKLAALDANIFRDTLNTDSNILLDSTSVLGSAKKGIAATYTNLRNICAIVMLAGLLFTGIRILISSNLPNKRAEWLKYLQDWLIGMALLIFSHVIMVMVFYISDTLVNALSQAMVGSGSNMAADLQKECWGMWDLTPQVVSLVCLGYMIYLTMVFAVAYFKRLLWNCVLIVIAPVVSIMYAFGNGTKSIYSQWLREYITNVLVQPFHMIVYYILFSVPLNAIIPSQEGFHYTNNIFVLIYALGCISFIRPAEKYIRELFGMNKGIVSMASFDSGKQTLNAVTDAIKDVVKKITMAVAVVATGGLAAGAVGAAGATGTAGAAGTATATKAGARAGATLTTGTEVGAAGGLSEPGVTETMTDAALDAGVAEPKESLNPEEQATSEASDELQQINAENVVLNAGNVNMDDESEENKTDESSKAEEEKNNPENDLELTSGEDKRRQ